MDKTTVKDNDTRDWRAPRGARFSTATYPLNPPAAKEAKKEDKGGWYDNDLQG